MLKDACRAIVQFMFTQVLIISFISSLPYFLTQCHLEMQQPRSWLPSSSCCCSPGWRGRAGGWLHYCRCDHFPGEFLPSSGELLSCWETPTIGERADNHLKAIEGNPCRQSRDRNQKTWSTAFKGSGKMLCKGSKKTTIGIPSKQHKYFQCVFLFIESCTNPFSRLWNITNNFNTLNKQRWNDSIQSVISDYQVFFIIATSLFFGRGTLIRFYTMCLLTLFLIGSPIVIFIVVFWGGADISFLGGPGVFYIFLGEPDKFYIF